MGMNDAHVEELLSAYLEGGLDESRSAEVGRHLESCPDCGLLLEAMKDAREALGALTEVEPSPALLRKLYAIPEKREKRRFRLVLDFLLRPSLQPVFAGATALLVFVSFLAFSSAGRTFQKSVNRQLHVGYSKAERLYAKAGALTDEMGSYKETILGSLKNVKLLKKDGEQ
jgi:anti-sigma factor RsiW